MIKFRQKKAGLNEKSSFSKSTLISFIAVFAAIGGWVLWRSYAAVTPSVPPVTRTLYGLHQDLTYFGGDPFWSNRIDILKSVNGEISRNSFLWSNIESTQGQRNWSRYDEILSRLEANGKKTMFVIYGSPTWANSSADQLTVPGNGSSSDPAFQTWADRYAAFAAEAAQRYKGRVAGWELWNEPNETYFWKAAPSVDQYEYWYRKVYTAMKAADPSANLALGGITGLYAGCCIPGSTFLNQLIDRGIPLDSVGIHPYDNDAPDTDTAYQPNFTDIGRIRGLLDGRGKQSVDIWVTEWGWSGTDAGSNIIQANYVKKSLEMIRDQYSYVTYATYFVDADTSGSYSQGLYQSDAATPKPAAQVFKDFMASLPPAVAAGSSSGSSSSSTPSSSASGSTSKPASSKSASPSSAAPNAAADKSAQSSLGAGNTSANSKAVNSSAPTSKKTKNGWIIPVVSAAGVLTAFSAAAVIYRIRQARLSGLSTSPASPLVTPTEPADTDITPPTIR